MMVGSNYNILDYGDDTLLYIFDFHIWPFAYIGIIYFWFYPWQIMKSVAYLPTQILDQAIIHLSSLTEIDNKQKSAIHR